MSAASETTRVLRRRRRAWQYPVLLALAPLLAACTAGTVSPEEPVSVIPLPSQTGPESCFLRRLVRSFQAIDQHNLVVFAPSAVEAFHVRIASAAPELPEATRVAFRSRTNRVCGQRDDVIFFEQTGSPPEYRILAISRLAEPELVALLEMAARRGPPGTNSP